MEVEERAGLGDCGTRTVSVHTHMRVWVHARLHKQQWVRVNIVGSGTDFQKASAIRPRCPTGMECTCVLEYTVKVFTWLMLMLMSSWDDKSFNGNLVEGGGECDWMWLRERSKNRNKKTQHQKLQNL